MLLNIHIYTTLSTYKSRYTHVIYVYSRATSARQARSRSGTTSARPSAPSRSTTYVYLYSIHIYTLCIYISYICMYTYICYIYIYVYYLYIRIYYLYTYILPLGTRYIRMDRGMHMLYTCMGGQHRRGRRARALALRPRDQMPHRGAYTVHISVRILNIHTYILHICICTISKLMLYTYISRYVQVIYV